jgi:acyl-coenzyme A synthetase/AMP-(fatty) acid ligase
MHEDATLDLMCTEALARDPSREAIEFDGTWVRWGQLRELAARVSGLLEQSGCAADAPIALVAHNRPSAAAALLGLLAQGRTVRMVYGFQSAAAIARDLERLEPSVVVASGEVFSPEVLDVLRATRTAAIAVSGLNASAVPGFEASLRDALTGHVPPEIQILTSGTTGPPKRFGMTHELVARHIVSANKNYRSDLDPSSEPPLFSYYPMGNISGIYGVLPPLLRGHRVVLVERFSVEAWLAYLRRYRPERASLPPAGFQMVLDAAVPREELAGLRSIATGAAPLDPNVHRAFEERYEIPILVSFGATEFAGPVTSMTLELHARWGKAKLGSAGRPIAGARLRVVDPVSGEVLAPGQEGTLEVIAPRIGPEWIRTSDLAMVDADGFLFHRGRADGAIVRGGFKLLPETIERALLLHPAVSAVAVVGLPDARLGQVPAAVVQFKCDAAQPSTEELERHLRAHLFATHIPVAWRVVEQLPYTPSLKVDRRAVRDLFAAESNQRSSGFAEAAKATSV